MALANAKLDSRVNEPLIKLTGTHSFLRDFLAGKFWREILWRENFGGKFYGGKILAENFGGKFLAGKCLAGKF
jgi:hypothetical protein